MQYPDQNETLSSLSQQIEISPPNGRITLRQFSLADVDDIFQLIERSRAHLSQHGDTTADNYKTPQDVEKSIQYPKKPKRLRFAIRTADGVLVGSINVTPDDDNPKRGEVGYYLGIDGTGQGYATEATHALSAYAFERLGYDELYAKVEQANEPSARVLIRAGYVEKGEEEGQRIFVQEKPTIE